MTDLKSIVASAVQAAADRTTQSLDTTSAARRLELGFDRIDRDRRRRTWGAVGIAAAAAVLVAGGVYGVTRLGSPHTDEPVGPPSPSPSTSLPLYNGVSIVGPTRYKLLVGDTNKGAAMYADVTLHGIWQGGNYPVASDVSGRYGGLAVYQPLGLAAGTGCLGGRENTQVATEPQALAQQLARLPKSTVLQPPTPVQAFDRNAVHLRLRIDQNCGKGVYRLADTVKGGHGISYGETLRGVIIDFWVENDRGVPVVVETWHQVGATSQMVRQIAQSRDSITFPSGE